ncbi:MAG: tetratricopeptide repeat protein [Catenulispora sp.]|nr:tetratricopeptide repeat protein [Catenulispora sp.]
MPEAPEPSRAADLNELISLLGELRAWAGSPSYRLLAKRVGPLMRPPQEVSTSTVVDVFKTSRRRLNADLLVAVVRALDLDEAAVARWREAYLRTQRVSKVDPGGVLRQLPADLATFTGRDRELATLLAAVEDAARAEHTVVISAIEGMAGVGKTQLAIHVAHELVRAGRYADVQLYANLRGFDPERSPADPAEVLGTFLRQLAVPAREIPDSAEERAAMFRDRLYGRQALVLLDNVASEEQVRQLIPADPGALVLITSRRRLTGLDSASLVVLDVFSDADALRLLGTIAGAERVAAEPESAAVILQMCAGLPLAVAIMAARLRSRPAWRLADLECQLRSGQTDAFGRGTGSPWPVFDVSYAGLDPALRRLFRLLAAHPGRDMPIESVAALAGVEPDQAWQLLEQLTDEYLVQQKSPGRYELHDLLRAFARRKLADDEPAAEHQAARYRLLSWYLVAADAASRTLSPATVRAELPPGLHTGNRPEFATAADATAWLGAELPNLVAVLEVAHEAGHHMLCCRIAAALTQYLRFEALYPTIIRIQRLALASARAVGDIADEATALTALGAAETDMYNTDALIHLTKAVELHRRTGSRPGLANAMVFLAVALTISDNPESSLDVAEEALAIARALDDHRLTMRILNNVAICLHSLRRSKDALDCVLESLALARSTGDPSFISVTERNLGFTYLVLDQFKEAEACFTEAASSFRDMGDSYRLVEALHGLARSQFGQGRTEQARRTVEDADGWLDSFDEASAARYRRQLESSPLRYSETTGIDPGAFG